MTKKEFILKTCISMASNKMFTTVNLDGCYILDTRRIIGGAEVLADKLEHDFALIFDSDDKPTSADSLQDIADNIDDIKEILRELSNK